MEFPGRFAMLNILCSLARGATANLTGGTYFTPTAKPLQCHEIKHINVRSTVDCALYCNGNLHSCAGYVHDYNTIPQFPCDICFIYDETTALVTISGSRSKMISMPDLNKATGGIPHVLIICISCILIIIATAKFHVESFFLKKTVLADK